MFLQTQEASGKCRRLLFFYSLISLFNNRRYNPQMDSPYIHTFYSMVAHLRTCLRYHHKGGGDSYKGRNSTVIPIAAAIL